MREESAQTKSKQDVSQTREDVARIRSALKVKIVSNFSAGKFLETRNADKKRGRKLKRAQRSTNWFEAPLIVGEHYSARQRLLCAVVLVDHWFTLFNCDEN